MCVYVPPSSSSSSFSKPSLWVEVVVEEEQPPASPHGHDGEGEVSDRARTLPVYLYERSSGARPPWPRKVSECLEGRRRTRERDQPRDRSD